MRIRVSPAFVVALAGGAAAACVLGFARAYARRTDAESFFAAVVTLATQALAIAVAALLLAGVLQLRRRVPAASIRLLLLGAVALTVAAIAHLVFEHLFADRAPDYLTVLADRRWLGRLDTTAALAFATGLVFLGEPTERARSLAVPLLLLAILSHPPLAIADRLAAGLDDVAGTPGVWKAAVVLGAIQVAYAAIALAVLDAAGRPSRS